MSLRREIKPIKNDMTLDELEIQLHLRMELKDELLKGQSHSRQQWIMRVINQLDNYDEKTDEQKKYFNRIFLGSDKAEKKGVADAARQDRDIQGKKRWTSWSELKKEWLVENLKQFDECCIKWRAPEVSVESLTTSLAADRKEVSPGQLTTQSMKSVIQALETEKKEMLASQGFIEVGEGGVGLQKQSTIISEKTKKKMLKAESRVSLMNDLIKKIKLADIAPLAPESLQHAKNLHAALKQLQADMKPTIGKAFIKRRSGLSKVMNVIHEEIPKKSVVASSMKRILK